jgi:hypothetical protein
MQNQFSCHKCGSPNTFGDKECRRCGARFQYYCPQCRSPIGNNDASCTRCGNRLSWPVRSFQSSGPAKLPVQSAVIPRKRSWVTPLIGLVLILAAAAMTIYFANGIISQKPIVPLSANLTVSHRANVPGPDTTAPTITNMGVQNLSPNSVQIQWITDEPSTSQVIWNARNQSISTTPQKEAMVTQHSVDLSNLASNSTYYYKVRSVDLAGNEAVSEQMSFDFGKQPGNPKIDVLMHSMYVESLPTTGTRTYIRGQVINNGNSPVNIKNIEITIKVTVPGKGSSELIGALDPYPEAIDPGEAHKFYVIVPNGANPDYAVSARIVSR